MHQPILCGNLILCAKNPHYAQFFPETLHKSIKGLVQITVKTC